MKKIIVFVLLICIIPSIFPQEKVLDLDESFSSDLDSPKDSYAISNQLNGDLMLLFEEKKTFNANLLNTQYKTRGKIVTEILPLTYQYILGYNIIDNTYIIFFSNSKYKKFGVQKFDFNNNTSVSMDLSFKLKKEKYVESVNYNNQIYLITVSKNSSNLNIYTFDEHYKPLKKEIPLEELTFTKRHNSSSNISSYHAITDYHASFNPMMHIVKIETQNPNVIETTSANNKLYQFDNEIILSFDYNDKETKICRINLNTYEANFASYDKPGKSEEGYKNSSSYIYDYKLFQIASSSKKMKFTVSDLNSKKIIKQYSVAKEDSITFKNSPIIQKGVMTSSGFSPGKIEKIEKTAKYLRKISSNNLGISVYKSGSDYNTILGGTTAAGSGAGAQPSSPSFGGGFGVSGTAGGFGSMTMSFNPTFYGYNDYSSSKSVYINCLFDKNFEHKKGAIRKNIYDMIDYFEDTLDSDPEAVNVFLHKSNIHYGYFDLNDQKYKLIRFD